MGQVNWIQLVQPHLELTRAAEHLGEQEVEQRPDGAVQVESEKKQILNPVFHFIGSKG
jgi:hypothetical protein